MDGSAAQPPPPPIVEEYHPLVFPNDNASMKEWALYYASLGWKILPIYEIKDGKCSCGDSECSAQGKHPKYRKDVIEHGVDDASDNPEQIEKWWTLWPHANIGIAAGAASKIAIFDVDGLSAIEYVKNRKKIYISFSKKEYF